MGRQIPETMWWKAAGLWLLTPLLTVGCAATDTSKQPYGPTAGSESSWTDKLTAPFKSSPGAVASSMDNRASTANDSDALSLSKKLDKKNPDLIVAIAQMQERAGKFSEAEKQYKLALKYKPKHLNALVGYAHLQDRQKKFEDATKLYKRAIAAHPTEAGVYNDLGLCFHRRGMMSEAQASLVKAVELSPDHKLYRNNLATVQVEQGQYDAALVHLTASHGEAAGHYNLGYLLAKKGENNRALMHLHHAATLDPTLVAAQQMIAKLSPQGPAGQPVPQMAAVPSVAQRYTITNPVTPSPVYVTVPTKSETTPVLPPAATQSSADPNAGRFTAPPTAVRYPNQQTSGYSGAGAQPPIPDQIR